jgi:predicted nucleic acid-binding protein
LRVFIDTNVLVFANQQTSPFHQIALQRLKQFESSNDEMWISRQVLREYLSVVTRSGGLTFPLPIASAITRVKSFERMFGIAEDGPAVSAQLFDLLGKVNASGKQIHDANVVATMMANGIDALLTGNTADFVRFSSFVRILPLVPQS